MDRKVENVRVDGVKLEQVKNLTYLGSTKVDNWKSEKKLKSELEGLQLVGKTG